MILCKQAFKTVRKNDTEVYKGFGFKHLSDATQYYVHPDNQSASGMTTICQPIGEAVMFMADFMTAVLKGDVDGDMWYGADGTEVYFNLPVPQDWRDAGVTNAVYYRGYTDITGMLKIGAYDKDRQFLKSNPDNLVEHNKLLGFLLLDLMKMLVTDSDYYTLFDRFVNKPNAEIFANVHEDFYQLHKNKDALIDYRDIRNIKIEKMLSFTENLKLRRENAKELDKTVEHIAEKFQPDDFPEEYRALIPELAKEFELPPELFAVCSAVTEGDIRALLLHGPAGTGKTMSCKLICREIGLPIMETVNCTENLDEFVLGKYLPDGDRIIFSESFVTKAIRYGGAVVFEEINFARPQYLAFLNSLLDDNGFVRLDNGEVVRRHKNFRFFATMNIGYFGTKELNQALYNRFNTVVELSELPDSAIKKMLTLRVPECESCLDNILGVYHKLKRKIEAEELELVISPRNLENWARLAKYEGYITAAEKTMIPIAKCDRSIEGAIRNIIMLQKW